MTRLDRTATHVHGTMPYAWPFNGDLSPAATAVLVIEPRGGSWPAQGAEECAAAAAEVARAVQSAGGAVVSVMTAPPRGESHPTAALTLPLGSVCVAAQGIDGFYGSSLDFTLRSRGIERLILVGIATETSIHSTMRTANDAGYECLLVADACLSLDPTLTSASISMIEMSGGIFGAVGTATSVVAAFTSRSSS
ncbi:MAG: hypothetical protein CVT64_08120 [Actinobacteria bacterium HGW-Actinobacteria-4]|nr:MAG: hypothetical protein CVT64_08120 [Actinobacteria bacterium HGW-Actinobacteria-4]